MTAMKPVLYATSCRKRRNSKSAYNRKSVKKSCTTVQLFRIIEKTARREPCERRPIEVVGRKLRAYMTAMKPVL